MSDYISREALIDRLNKNLSACNHGTFSEMCYSDAIETVKHFPAADVEPVRRWIPCSDRLPEKEGWYLVTSYSQVQKRKYTTMKPFCEGAFRSLCEVSHWMPLPEPPEEGGDGNAAD